MSLSGKVNLGLNGLTSSNLWYPFINIWKMSDETEVFSSIGNLNKLSSLPPGVANSAWLDGITGQVYLDANGDLVNPLPADATFFTRRFETVSTNILPTPFTRVGEPWVLTFDGVSTSVSIAWSNIVRVGNRITGTWPDGAGSRQVSFTGIDHSNPPRNFKMFPAAWESLLNAGAIFNPDWLSQISIGSGIIRFMDWQSTNSNRSTRSFSDIPTEAFYIWGGFNCSNNENSTYLKGGMPASIMTSLSAQANTSAWVCIPHVFGVAKTSRIGQSATAAITIASPGVITWLNHLLPANWPVRFTTTGALPSGFVVGTVYYVVGASVTTDTFQLSATSGGAAINTSGTQSGTHTAFALGITQTNPPIVFSRNNPFVNGDLAIPYVFAGMSQSTTVTITIATPGVITWTSHPLQANNGVRFSTTGTLPTGIIAGNTYYVVGASILANSFEISAAPGGVSINTTGSQSGVHTATTEIVRNTFTVANATANTFELTGVNASGFSAFASDLGWLTSPYSLSGMTTQITLLATHFLDNMPRQIKTYFEFSNEVWNSIFDAFHWLAAQSRLKFPNDNTARMTGYLLAHCMKTIRDVFGTANRSRWRGILATHSINVTTTNEIFAGVDQYLTENPSLILTDLVDYLAIVGYWGGNLAPAYAAISQAWVDDSITRFNAGLEPTKYAYFDRKINADLYNGVQTSIPFSMIAGQAYWVAQKAIADSKGIGLIQYEGGNSNALADGGLTGNAQWREFFPQGTQTASDAANYTAMFQDFATLGGVFPAKFTEANPVNAFGSFGAMRWPGDANPVWQSVVKFNGTTTGRLR